jgi:hypothetical protein
VTDLFPWDGAPPSSWERHPAAISSRGRGFQPRFFGIAADAAPTQEAAPAECRSSLFVGGASSPDLFPWEGLPAPILRRGFQPRLRNRGKMPLPREKPLPRNAAPPSSWEGLPAPISSRGRGFQPRFFGIAADAAPTQEAAPAECRSFSSWEGLPAPILRDRGKMPLPRRCSDTGSQKPPPVLNPPPPRNPPPVRKPPPRGIFHPLPRGNCHGPPFGARGNRPVPNTGLARMWR